MVLRVIDKSRADTDADLLHSVVSILARVPSTACRRSSTTSTHRGLFKAYLCPLSAHPAAQLKVECVWRMVELTSIHVGAVGLAVDPVRLQKRVCGARQHVPGGRDTCNGGNAAGVMRCVHEMCHVY